MYFLKFCIVAFGTLFLTQIAATQIIGIILFMLPKKKYITIIGLIFWLGTLIGLYFIVNKWFEDYDIVYFWASVIAIIISLLNINNLKNEVQ